MHAYYKHHNFFFLLRVLLYIYICISSSRKMELQWVLDLILFYLGYNYLAFGLHIKVFVFIKLNHSFSVILFIIVIKLEET